MAKIVRTLTLLISISVMLFASSPYLKQVYSYDKKIEQADKNEMFRIFHSLQNIYIKSIINNDTTLKRETLKRLIKSSKILKLSPKNYENELRTLTSHDTIKPKIHPKSKPSGGRKKQIPANDNFPLLQRVVIGDHDVTLYFNKNIAKKAINTFAINGKHEYKKVFDFHARLSTLGKLKTPRGLKEIRIAWYNKNTVRMVLVSTKVIRYRFSIHASKIHIYYTPPLSSHKKITKKSSKKPTPKVTKKAVKKTNFLTFNPRNKIIVLDPGHGGKDSGAIGYKRRYEKNAVLSIALKTYKELKKRGYRVYMTRRGDYFVKLRNRTRFANQKRADLFISIHANAAPKKSQYYSAKGLETFFLSPARSARSKRVAALENRVDLEDMDYYSKNTFLNLINREKIVQANKMALDVQQGILQNVRKKYHIVDGGVRKAPFWVLVGAQMPAILIETGYITNPTEGTRLFSFYYQNLIAKGIADGVDNYFLKN
ncbi:N-acetylmuramoyl-L-alanine amidase family protein [Sulfurospirillum sp. 1612]|uniref:N-acetylmuramoyl-L-alanine amidase family protein n=1 Tax=Sulfurospirillum sp. 1612 TaxID=3094835 RepID=UPI002F9420BE